MRHDRRPANLHRLSRAVEASDHELGPAIEALIDEVWQLRKVVAHVHNEYPRFLGVGPGSPGHRAASSEETTEEAISEALR